MSYLLGEMSTDRRTPIVPVELRVSGSIHLPHAAFADLGGDRIRAEGGAGLKWRNFHHGFSEPEQPIDLHDEGAVLQLG